MTYTVGVDGLKPHLEMILREILEAIQVRANESGSDGEIMNKSSEINDLSEIKKTILDAERQECKDTNGEEKSSYYLHDGHWCRSKKGRNDEEITIRLCNFTAEICQEDILDDGKDITLNFIIQGKLHGAYPLPALEIPAANFNSLSWVSRWGCKPTLSPGQTVRDFVRHAIQTQSINTVSVFKHFAHTGWRTVDGQTVYLHTGGAIGSSKDISVKLPIGLDRYCLPPSPPTTAESPQGGEKEALEASLSFLDIGSRMITLPLFCLVYLSPLTTLLSPLPNFSMYLYGQSGTFKTSVAILALCHLGSFSGVESLSNFDDTISNLEKRSFTLKDSLFVVDDYHPSAHKHNAAMRENTVQRLIRNHSNRTARGRMNADMTEKGRYEPRSMLLLTAEELPSLESTLARVCVVEIADGAIDKGKLTELQSKAGLLPHAMASYLSWIRENMTAIVGSFPGRFVELRQMAATDGLHKKLPEQAAFLRFGMETAVSFLHDKGVVSGAQGNDLVSEAWAVFRELSEKQQQRISDDDPLRMSVDMLVTMLQQHSIRLDSTSREGTQIGAGDRIGYWDENFLYLIPTATWHAIQMFCSKEGTFFPFQRNTFFQMLRNKKTIQPGPTGENTLFVKICGKSVRVLKVVDRGFYERAVATT